MASEKLLIDANALIRRLFPIAMNLAKEYGSLGGAVSGVIGHIYDEPTVDAVEVVRCRDCKFYEELNGKDSGKPVGYGYCINPTGINGIAYEDDFCSYGERKDGDGNG